MSNISIINTISKEELLSIINNSKSISSVLNHFGKNPSGAARKTLYKRCRLDNIDIKNLIKFDYTGRRKKFSNEEVFIENSVYSRKNLKTRILRQRLIPYNCKECGMEPFWNGKELKLILDHKNGIYNDHRIENLRFLCPNCNSQTPTFAGKNNKNQSS